MNSSSCSTRCLICTTICLSVVFLTILTVLIVYHHQNKSVGNNSDVQHWSMKIINDRSSTKKRQSIDLTEDETKICDDVENYFVKQRAELFHKRQEKWQSFQEQIDRLLIETDERNETSIHRFYRLCRKESSDVLNKEVEKFFQNLIEEEPFRSFLTLIKRNRSSTLNSNQFFANPFFKIESLTPKEYRIVRIDRTSFPVDANIFFDSKFADLNRTAWFELVQFEENYRRIIEDEKKFIEIYSNEFNEDSLIVRRISQISNYEKCRKPFRQTTGIEILIEMINDYIENVLPEINRKYLERQIDSLHKIKDNRTLVQRFRRIQIELNTIDRLLSTNRTSKSCLIDLLGNLFDRRMNRNDLPNIFDDFLPKNEKLFFVSDDWPFFVMLIDRFLKNWSRNVFVNSIFYETYHRTIFPYYFPHRSISNFSSFESCRIESCLDILLCFHPDSIEDLINKQFQVSLLTVCERQSLRDFSLLREWVQRSTDYSSWFLRHESYSHLTLTWMKTSVVIPSEANWSAWLNYLILKLRKQLDRTIGRTDQYTISYRKKNKSDLYELTLRSSKEDYVNNNWV